MFSPLHSDINLIRTTFICSKVPDMTEQKKIGCCIRTGWFCTAFNKQKTVGRGSVSPGDRKVGKGEGDDTLRERIQRSRRIELFAVRSDSGYSIQFF